MASGTLSPPPVAPPEPPLEEELFIEQRLRSTQRQVKLIDAAAALAVWTTGVLFFLLALTILDHWILPLGAGGRWLALLGLLAGTGWFFKTHLLPLLSHRINRVFAAKVIEDGQPTLKNSLLNFLLLRNGRGAASEVVLDALRHRAADDLSHVSIDGAVDRTPAIRLGYILCGVTVLLGLYKILSPKDPFQTFARIAAPWADIARPSRVRITSVEPGNAETFQGRSVAVVAEIHGARANDAVKILYSTADGQTVDAVVEMRSDGGLQFRGTLPGETKDGESPGLRQDLEYRVLAGDAVSPLYRLHVLPAPRIDVEQVELHYPDYTGKPMRMQERQGDIKAIEGTRIVVRAKATQKIASAVIEFNPDRVEDSGKALGRRIETLPLQSTDDKTTGEFTLLRNADGSPRFASYQLRFSSADGLRNDQPTLHRIETASDLAPEIEILKPTERRSELPLDATLDIELRARDPDFALRRVELAFQRGDQELQRETLLNSAQGKVGPTNARVRFSPAKMKLRVGDEIALIGIASDNRRLADGAESPNVTRTDRYIVRITEPVQTESSNNPSEDAKTPSNDSQEKKNPNDDKGNPDKKNDPPADDKKSDDPQDDKQEKQEKQDDKQGESGKTGEQQGKKSDGSQEKNKKPQQGDEQSGGSQKSDAKSNAGGGKGSEKASEQSGGEEGDGQSSEQQSGDQTGSSGSKQGSSGGESKSGGEKSNDSGEASTGEKNSTPGENSGSEGSGKEQGDAQAPSKPAHDGEAIEEALRRMKEKQDAAGNATKGQSPGEKTDEPNSPNLEGKSGEKSDGQGNDDTKQGEKAAKSAGGKAGGEKSKSGGSKGGEPEGPDAESGKSEQGANPEQGKEPPADKASSEKNDKSKAGGKGDSGKNDPTRNAGDKSASGEPQKQQRENSQSGEATPGDAASKEASPPSQSEKNSNNQGENSGDKSGNGKKDAGQSTGAKGNDAPGSSQSADEGAGKSEEAGMGETGDKAGDGPEAKGKTGSKGNKPGKGSESSKEAGNDSKSNEAGKESGSGKESPPNSKSGESNADPSKTSSNGKVTGGGKASDGSSNPNAEQSPPELADESEDLEYAKKTTDLALQYLKDQKDNPDPELLKRLGWSKDDLNAFLQRWESLKNEAREDDVAKKDLEESYRGLGLRPSGDKRRSAGTVADAQRSLRDAGARSDPPGGYAEQFKAFRSSISKDRSK